MAVEDVGGRVEVSDDTKGGADDDTPGDTPDDTPGEPPPGATDDPATPRRRPSRTMAATGLVALFVLVGVVAVVRQPPPRPDGRVILYGDSLSVESAGAFQAEVERTTDADVVIRALPGISPCDALDEMEQDLALDPTVVVLQFVGNNASPCIQGPGGEELTGRALADRLEADASAATEMFATEGVRVVLVGGPPAPGLPGDASREIADAYDEIVNEWAGRDLGRVRYADAAATVTGADHAFVRRLPCRDDEGEDDGCEDGEVVVRSADRIHFCPVEHDEFACPVPAPGARRFGEEMARVAGMALGDY